MIWDAVDHMIGRIFCLANQGRQVLLRQGVENMCAFALGGYQPAVFQQPQLVRYRRFRYPRQARQIPDAKRLLRQSKDNFRPSRIRQGGKDVDQYLKIFCRLCIRQPLSDIGSYQPDASV